MKFINLHTHQYTQQSDVLEVVNQYPQQFNVSIPEYSMGIHPWYIAKDSTEADLLIIESKLQEANCLALGECGLDKRIPMPIDLQQTVFEQQVFLAQKYNKPIIVHCVAAFQELIAIKKRMNILVPMVIHGFSKNSQVADQLVANGFYLSFGKSFFNAQKLGTNLETVFKNVPNNRIFLETDTIQEGIQSMYELAAKIKGISLECLQEIIKDNFFEVFNFRL